MKKYWIEKTTEWPVKSGDKGFKDETNIWNKYIVDYIQYLKPVQCVATHVSLWIVTHQNYLVCHSKKGSIYFWKPLTVKIMSVMVYLYAKSKVWTPSEDVKKTFCEQQ